MDGQADQLANNGWALYQGGNAPGALREFASALALNPDHRSALIGVTQAHIALNELSRADEAADHLLELEPNLSQAHRIKGELLRRSRKFPQAERYLQEAIRLDPNDPLGYHFLGVVDFERKRYGDALKTILEGRRIAPWYGVLAAQQALILLHTKGPKAAEPFAEEALQLSAEEDYVLTIVARVALMRGRIEKARNLLEVVLQRDANDEQAISLYLLTEPDRYRFLRAHVQFPFWRKDHGVTGWAVWLGVWAAIFLFLIIIAIGGRVFAFIVAVGYRLFWANQYQAHRKQVRQHFARPVLNPGY
ncbi:MAG: tetratricopeptide repeat protein [Hyphomonadaceae bacterium]